MFGLFKKRNTKKTGGTANQNTHNAYDAVSATNNAGELKSYYEIIRGYSDIIAYIVSEDRSAPSYAVKWLAESFQMGREIEPSAVRFSVENSMPYFCETEEETWVFEKEENPLLNNANGIWSALLYYKYTGKDERKHSFWMERALSLADQGDYMVRAMLCFRGGGMIDGRYDGVLTETMWDNAKSRYSDSVQLACSQGNPQAQIAMAEFGANLANEERLSLLQKAILQKSTDACYYMIKKKNLIRYENNGFTVNIPPYGTPEWTEYMAEELYLYKMGAEYGNGTMAGYCQYRLADMYESGDYVEKDPAASQYWYKMALQNGCRKAASFIR